MGRAWGGPEIAGLVTGLLLLTSCATSEGPPAVKVPPNGQETPKVAQIATPRAPAGPEAATPPPETAPLPATEPAPALEGPAAETKPAVLPEPQPAQEAPVSQQVEVVPAPTPAKAPEVPAGPIRVTDVELDDVGPTAATVLIKSDKPILNYEAFSLLDPPRLVVNIYEAIHAVPERAEALARGPVKKIRSSQYRRRPVQIVRVVMDLASDLPYLPHLSNGVHATPGPLQIAIGDAVTKVAAKAPVTAEAPKAPAPEKPETLAGLSKSISLDLRQMDVRAVMKFLARQGDLNIVTGKNVGGRVTLSTKDTTIRDALDIIAVTHELAYVLQNPIIHVMTEADYQRLFGTTFSDQRQVKTLHLQHADATNAATVLGNLKSALGRVVADAKTGTVVLMDVPEKLEQMVAVAESMDRATQLQTQVFELRYGKAEDVKAEVEKVFTPELGAVRLDTRTNTLVVTDLPPKMREIQQLIKAFDRKTRQVIIEAKIIQMRLDDRFQLGVDWEVLLENLHDLSLKTTFPIPVASSGKLTIGTLPADKFTAVIEALETVGKTNILSTPQIAVVENEEASILVGSREAFITSVVTQTAQAATTAEEVSFIDVGVQLKVTPSINEDGFVTMKIKPEVSAVPRTLTTASGNEIPIVETSTAETTVMVKDGTTIIIAGLMKDETVTGVKKVPVLGDIPILGLLFRSKDEKLLKSELVFFLTPSIISGEESVGSVAAALDRKNTRKRSTEK